VCEPAQTTINVTRHARVRRISLIPRRRRHTSANTYLLTYFPNVTAAISRAQMLRPFIAYTVIDSYDGIRETSARFCC